MAFVKLIEAHRCPPGRGTFVQLGERELAVFQLANPTRFVVVGNACPHAGGNLSGGALDGPVVECPWHQWRFDLDRAACVDSDKVRLARYPVELREGFIYVDPDAAP